MNKKPVFVVEGKTDVCKLTNLIDADFVITNGAAIPEETIEYIKELVKTRKVIILTDPDFPGLQIRNKISQEVPGVYHAYVDRSKSSNGKKLGVAECEIEELKNAISHYICYDKQENTEDLLTMTDLIELGLTGTSTAKENRDKVSKKFHTGYSNAKTLLKHLNMLGVTLKELKEVLKNDCE